MTPKAMKTLGTIMLIVGICMAVPCFVVYMFSIIDHHMKLAVVFLMGYLLGSLSAFGSIPLLIVSGIKIRNAENKTAREEIYGYCPKCGKRRVKDDTFCSKCGTQLPY